MLFRLFGLSYRMVWYGMTVMMAEIMRLKFAGRVVLANDMLIRHIE